MNRGCDVCQEFRPAANRAPDRKLTRVTFGSHTVTLCEAHRLIAARSGVTTFGALRDLYRESDRRRSYVPRRTRTAEAAPPSERRQNGRRATDG